MGDGAQSAGLFAPSYVANNAPHDMKLLLINASSPLFIHGRSPVPDKDFLTLHALAGYGTVNAKLHFC